MSEAGASGTSPLVSRRRFLFGAVMAGSCLLVGGVRNGVLASEEQIARFGPFLRISPDGEVIIVSKHSEMGQGAQSGLAAIVAEELDADWQAVRVEMAPANAATYGHTRLKGLQITGGSTSIRNSWDQLRRAGAAARSMFVAAASELWQVPPTEIQVSAGTVLHPESGRKAGFGDLLVVASRQPIPENPVLKAPREFRLVGSEQVGRLDTREKTTGEQVYTLDVSGPNLLTAVVEHSPRFGGRLERFNADQAMQVPGVVQVFEIPTGVAVVAEDTYAALKGREALEVHWDDTSAEMRSSEEIHNEHRELADGRRAARWIHFESIGSFDGLDRAPAEVLEFRYDFPYLAHAAMEPMNCVAAVDGQRVKLQYGAQSQTADQRNIAPIIGCQPSEVEIETLHSGGSFGRRSVARSDYQTECVQIAKRIGGGRPVKLVWTREDDMTAGEYRPIAHHRIRIRVAANGFPSTWDHALVCAPILAGTQFERPGAADSAEHQAVEGVRDSTYFRAIPSVRARVAYTHSPITTLWLRSVGHTHTAMAMEHSIDQLARRAGIDPADYRRQLYRRAGDERHLGVLERALKESGWGDPIEAGWARGIAVHQSFGSVVANVAEVAMVGGEPRVRRVVVAVDCGIAVCPDQVRAQMEGGVNFGLSIALYGEVKIERGVPQATNFHNYRVLRMSEAPDIETHIVASDQPPSGTGEPGTPVIAPAVANALLSLTGQATVRLPIVRV